IYIILYFASGSYGMELINAGKVSKSLEESKKVQFLGWLDENGDGINDKFRDANGNGINDITNEKYPHKFQFVDKNGDGINDIFIDFDGDGVNDLNTSFIDNNKDGINDNIFDYNKDGINDITGLKYKKDNVMGYRYGIVEEEAKRTYKKFIDENKDGMHDPIARSRFFDEDGDGINDRFIDKDGDGICDGRNFGQRKYQYGHENKGQGKQQRKGHGGKRK
ncbi:MAG: hypothetical protein ACUVWN_17820, partial [bacterium]